LIAPALATGVKKLNTIANAMIEITTNGICFFIIEPSFFGLSYDDI
jgi:hypothetical protein